MATAKKSAEAQNVTLLDPGQARVREELYRNGVDISTYELADCFDRDGYDWRQALKDCGYSEDEISDVDHITSERPTETTPAEDPQSESDDSQDS